MVQNQLVEYVTAQMKLGVSREAIKSALVGVGWQAADVEDSLKKAESDIKPIGSSPVAAVSPAPVTMGQSATAQARPIQAISPMATAGPSASRTPFSPMDIVGSGARTERLSEVAKPVAAAPVSQSKAPASQPIKVSDFMGSTVPSTGAMAGKLDKMAGTAFKGSMPKGVGHTGERISMVAEGVGLIALAALTIYLYTQNSTLSAKVNSVSTASVGASSQLTDLQSQLQTLTTDKGTLQGQVSDLTTKNTDLAMQLSFFAAPIGTSTAASGTIVGTVAAPVGAKGAYSVRTQYNAVILVKNSSDAKVAAILKPLVGTSATLAGSYILGSDAFTVETVNGNPVNPPPVAPIATSTASAPAPAPTSTPPPVPPVTAVPPTTTPTSSPAITPPPPVASGTPATP